MKIICLECKRVIGEKYPFDDPRETHTFCRQCAEQELIEKRYRPEAESRFSPSHKDKD